MVLGLRVSWVQSEASREDMCVWEGGEGSRSEGPRGGSPEGGVYLQGLRQHLGPYVLHAIAAQIHLSQAGVAAKGIDEDAGA